MDYALIKNGIVQNIILADAAFVAGIASEWDHIELLDDASERLVGIGWGWTAQGGFTPPAAPPAPPAPPEQRFIFVGSFFDRFGAHKWPILADANPMVQALVKDCQVRRYIDLDNAELPSGLVMLVQAGHEIDPDAVINAPITESERWTA